MRRVALAVAIACLFAACGGDNPAAPPTVASIQVTPGQDTLVTLGRTRQFSATALDAQGRPVSGVTIVWRSSNPGVATVDSVTGLATAVGNGLSQIRAVAGSVTGQATLAVSQVVASVIVTPPTANFTTVGVTQAFNAVARDSSNATVTGVRFLWGSSDPAVATVDTLGVATARGVGQTTISATGRGVPGYAGVSVSQTGTQLAFSVGPSGAVAGEAINPAMQVEVRDAAGNLVTGSRAAVTLAFGANPGNAALHGSTTVNAVGGIATFSGIMVERAAAGYTLVASATAATPATSGAFTISPASATALQFYPTALTDTAGQGLPLEVHAVDRFGNLTPSAVGAVWLRISMNPTGATLINSNFAATVTGGVASLSIYSIQKAGSGYRFVATGDGGVAGLDSAFSPLFTVNPASPSALAYVQQPGLTLLGSNLLVSRIRAQDAFGNLTPGSNTITVALGGNPWGATLSGTTTRSGADTVRFDSLRINKPGLGYTVVASAPGLTSAITPAFSVLISSGASAQAAGASHTCALLFGGAVACWGDNTFGQLGTVLGSDSIPTLVFGTTVFTQVTAGDRHTCALDGTGAAWCWGDNANGQLGNAAAGANSPVPVLVDGSHQFTAMSAGANHTCGVATGGAAYCWGANGAGQLGDSGKVAVSTTTPQLVYGALTYRAIAAGGSHTCALAAADSTPRCWGDDTFGQLGDSALTVGGSDTAVVVPGTLKLRGIDAGASHTCGNTSLGTFCWGRNNHGQLGNANLGVDSDKPVTVTGASSLTGMVAAGGDHSCGTTGGAGLYCWGSNATGELGNGLNPADAAQASLVQTGGQATSFVTAGGAQTCGRIFTASGNKMFCWGANAQGQLGDGTRTNRSLFTAVREQ